MKPFWKCQPRLASKWESTTWPTVLGLSLLHMVTWGLAESPIEIAKDDENQRGFHNVGSLHVLWEMYPASLFKKWFTNYSRWKWTDFGPATVLEQLTQNLRTFTCQVGKFTWQVGKMEGWLHIRFFSSNLGVIFICRFQQSIIPMVFCALIFRWTQEWMGIPYVPGRWASWMVNWGYSLILVTP